MSRPLTVVQLLPELHGGGVEQGTLEVAAGLVARGDRAIVISGGGRLTESLIASGGEHYEWPIGKKSPLTLRWVWALRRLLMQESIDLVHARSRLPAWVAWLAVQSLPRGRRPVFLTTAHGLYSVNAYSAIMARGERVIAISDTVQRYLIEKYHVPPERVCRIYRGVDPADFPDKYQPPPVWRDQWDRDFPACRPGPVITLAGRLTRLKGHTQFLELVARLRRQFPTLHGLIVGGVDPRRQGYAAELHSLVEQRGLRGAISFTGHRTDVREIFAVSDLVVSLTTNPPEAFGRTVLEALSLGRPVAGYGHSGVGEILSELFPAGMVPAGDLDAFTKTAATLLQTAPTVRANTVFTRDRMLTEEFALYDELTARAQVDTRGCVSSSGAN